MRVRNEEYRVVTVEFQLPMSTLRPNHSLVLTSLTFRIVPCSQRLVHLAANYFASRVGTDHFSRTVGTELYAVSIAVGVAVSASSAS